MSLRVNRPRRSIGQGLCLAAGLALLSCLALAQDEHPVPKVELFGGYSWMHPGGTLGTRHIPDLKKGWAASGTYNFSKYVGLTIDGSGHYSDFSNIGTAMIGPTFSARSEDGLRFFGEGMAGLHRFSPSGLSSNNKIGLRAGGGMDLPLLKNLSWRVFQADYLWSQHTFAGVVGPSGVLTTAHPK